MALDTASRIAIARHLLASENRMLFKPAEPIGPLVEIFTYWAVKRGERRMPARRDLDPADIPRLLPHVVLLDVVGMPPRFCKRLVGTAIVAREGRDSTGQWLHESLNPAIRGEVIRQHQETVDRSAMTCYAASFIGIDRKPYRYRRMLLPLSSDGTTVDKLFGGAVFAGAEDDWD